MNILFSIPYATTLQPDASRAKLPADVTLHFKPRTSDWGVRGIGRYMHYFREAIRLLRLARQHDVLVLCTVSIEAFIVARCARWFAPRTPIILYDFLIPRESRSLRFVAGWLKRVDFIACIRTGDIEFIHQRFGIPRERLGFVPFPHDPSIDPAGARDEGYIYSAGWAHRDWPTLMAALARLPYRAILSTGAALDLPPECRERITLLPMQSPADGRRLMAGARLVVLPFLDTHLPSGPLVLLDALAFGKAVVATSVNGTRDYATDMRDALLVPAGDVDALASAIDRAMSDAGLRGRLAAAGVAAARALPSVDESMWRLLQSLVRQARPRFAGLAGMAGISGPAAAPAQASMSESTR